MNFHTLTLGPLATNCYILYSGSRAAVIDPAQEPEKILSLTRQEKLQISYIIYTHSHWDHTAAAKKLKEESGAEIVAGTDKEEFLRLTASIQIPGITSESAPPDICAGDGYEFNLGDEKLKIISTPGHSPGGISLYIPGMLFSGDAIFLNSAGRTDLPGGSSEILKKSVKEKIFSLPAETRIYPGHGPPTSVKWEKENNPFFSFG